MGKRRHVVAKGPKYGASGGRVSVVVFVGAVVPVLVVLFMVFWVVAVALLFCWF